MKDVVQCLSCGTIYPPELVSKWGRSAASAAIGPEPRCPAVVPNPHARPVRDRDTDELIHPEQLCRGPLSAKSVADSAKVEDIQVFSSKPHRGYPGYWRQASAREQGPPDPLK